MSATPTLQDDGATTSYAPPILGFPPHLKSENCQICRLNYVGEGRVFVFGVRQASYPNGTSRGSSRRSPRPPSRMGRGNPLSIPLPHRRLWRLGPGACCFASPNLFFVPARLHPTRSICISQSAFSLFIVNVAVIQS